MLHRMESGHWRRFGVIGLLLVLPAMSSCSDDEDDDSPPTGACKGPDGCKDGVIKSACGMGKTWFEYKRCDEIL